MVTETIRSIRRSKSSEARERLHEVCVKMFAAAVALHWLTWGVRIRTARSGGGATWNAHVALNTFRR